MGWVVSSTPRPLYPRERPGTHCTGGWVGRFYRRSSSLPFSLTYSSRFFTGFCNRLHSTCNLHESLNNHGERQKIILEYRFRLFEPARRFSCLVGSLLPLLILLLHKYHSIQLIHFYSLSAYSHMRRLFVCRLVKIPRK